jgi:hypothetical protein
MSNTNYCLALYDVTGIQSFVFASPRAKENLGASVYVRQLFDHHLRNILGAGTAAPAMPISGTLRLQTNTALKSEIIYIGGGNAMVLFLDRAEAVAATKKLSERLLVDTRLSLGLAVAYIDTDLSNFLTDRKMLFKQLAKSKASRPPSRPLQGISITHECIDGQPSIGAKGKNGEYISVASDTNLKMAETETVFKTLLPQDWAFPLEFDKLGGDKGEQSHIAIVHIDGNNMGAFIEQQLGQKHSYPEAVESLRHMSREIQNAYESVFKDLCVAISAQMTVLKDTLKSDPGMLPLRPLILSGDDITFVCDGRIALQLTAKFLTLLNQQSIGSTALSACAGIAITGSHFPFHRAYELAEALCANAKRTAKETSSDNPGSWMDYHVVHAGFETDLEHIRKRAYSVPGMASPPPIGTIPLFNLLLRPFPVAGGTGTPTWRWADIAKMSETVGEAWPRSAHKALRNAFVCSGQHIDETVEHNRSRGRTLPTFELEPGVWLGGGNVIFHNNRTPFFEPLEMMDYYLPELSL